MGRHGVALHGGDMPLGQHAIGKTWYGMELGWHGEAWVALHCGGMGRHCIGVAWGSIALGRHTIGMAWGGIALWQHGVCVPPQGNPIQACWQGHPIPVHPWGIPCHAAPCRHKGIPS